MSGQARRQWRDIDGILLLDKPEGLSSNRALQIARRIFNARKGGHTGSLDPFATGMLPLCFGQSTKVSGQMLDADKCYRVQCRLGVQTSTGDPEGEVIAEAPVPTLERGDIEQTLQAFCGEIQQVPPMYSALKHQGQRLYQLARQGIEVKREPRRVRILALTLDAIDGDTLTLTVQCSKGTYIRTLVQDLARAWGTIAHATTLRRLWVAPFMDAPMVTLEQLETFSEQADTLQQWLLPTDRTLVTLPACHLTASQARQLRFGQPVSLVATKTGRVRAYDPEGEFIGVGELDATGTLRARRLMATTPPTG